MTPAPARRALLTGLAWGACGVALGAAIPEFEARAYRARALRTSDGVRLNVLESTAPPAPYPAAALAIVLVPGWCMPARIWEAQIQDLGPRWRTLALDPRGQGDSEVAAQGYTADRRADDLHDLLQDPLQDLQGPVVLVAWSLGVLDALQYVYRHGSSRLAGLMLVDNSIGEPPAPKGSDFLARLRRARAPTVAAFVRSMFAHPPPQETLDRLRDAALRMPLEASIALLSYPLAREHWRDIVHDFAPPLAYVVTPHFRQQAQHLLAARPASRVEIFEQAGHALFVDEPARFNRLLADWIGAVA